MKKNQIIILIAVISCITTSQLSCFKRIRLSSSPSLSAHLPFSRPFTATALQRTTNISYQTISKKKSFSYLVSNAPSLKINNPIYDTPYSLQKEISYDTHKQSPASQLAKVLQKNDITLLPNLLHHKGFYEIFKKRLFSEENLNKLHPSFALALTKTISEQFHDIHNSLYGPALIMDLLDFEIQWQQHQNLNKSPESLFSTLCSIIFTIDPYPISKQLASAIATNYTIQLPTDNTRIRSFIMNLTQQK